MKPWAVYKRVEGMLVYKGEFATEKEAEAYCLRQGDDYFEHEVVRRYVSGSDKVEN